MSPPLAIERVRPAYKQVSDQLRQLILRGDILPGDRLPVETDLAIQFGVSRSTVREALRSLASENLVITKRGVNGGSFVTEPNAESLSTYLETNLGMLAGRADISIDELLEARSFFEVPAAERAALRRTDEQLERLQTSLARPDQPGAGHDFEGHKDFHLAIMEASGNRLLTVVTRPIFSVLRTRFLRDQATAEFWRCVVTDHEEIYQAIELQDDSLAGRLMSEHLSRLRETYERIDIETNVKRLPDHSA